MRIPKTPAQIERAYLRALATRFEQATRAHEMRGGGNPADIPEIERNYQNAKRRLLEAMGISL